MRASAPAKAILLGEHAVVHGVPAIAVPISARRTEVEVVESDAGREITVHDERGHDTALAAEMTRLALDQGETPARGARVRIASTIPVGSGLGSSAALAVALVRACRGGRALEPAEVARRANELEKLAHGTPSGIDAAAIAFERAILFRRGAPPEPLALARPVRFAVAILPRTGTTASLVAGVRRLKEEAPARFADALERVRAAVEAGVLALGGASRGSPADAPRAGPAAAAPPAAMAPGAPPGAPSGTAAKNLSVSSASIPHATLTNKTNLATAMTLNREALHDLGVSTLAVERACDAAIGTGALAAKLSGAGGGGAILALLGPDSDPDRVLGALLGSGALEAFVTEVGAS